MSGESASDGKVASAHGELKSSEHFYNLGSQFERSALFLNVVAVFSSP